LKVSLVSSSEPSKELVEQGIVNAQELVAYCARVSNPANQTNTETSEKLIRYLIKHQHWSPLEMVSACLEIETTETLLVKSYGIEVLASKSLVSVML
jgi:thymidylate synthase ThyX